MEIYHFLIYVVVCYWPYVIDLWLKKIKALSVLGSTQKNRYCREMNHAATPKHSYLSGEGLSVE